MRRSFGADTRKWADKTAAQLLDVAQGAVSDVVDEMQTPVPKGGRLPLDTAALRNSLVSGVVGGNFTEGPVSYELAIATMRLGDVLRFSYTMPYALRMEVGFSGEDSLGRVYDQKGFHYMSTAAGNFSTYFDQRAARV